MFPTAVTLLEVSAICTGDESILMFAILIVKLYVLIKQVVLKGTGETPHVVANDGLMCVLVMDIANMSLPYHVLITVIVLGLGGA